jgi:hypothetical protein
MLFSGFGKLQDVTLNIESHFAILLISDNLVESLAEADWEENERNAMVARIARMTMTTISSTRVKALIFFVICIYKLIKAKIICLCHSIS